MIYKDLSISLGGGIIPNFQLADSNDCANIIIGLGGTGIECLKEVKKQVYNRIKPDDITSDIPTYQHTQFLAIDSDRCSINGGKFAGIDSVNDFFDIGCSDINAVLAQPKLLRQTPSLRWLSDKISIRDAQTGAGGVRQVGRLLMMMRSDSFKKTIIDKVKSALQGLDGAKLNIHIFTGLGGGTGSGVFLDVCYIIRHIIEELALEGRAEVAGYFFLPDVNLEKVKSDAVRKYININGYAAMKELDYCMSFDKNGGEWNQEYNNFMILSKQSPVDNAYLVSSINIDGDKMLNSYKYAIDTVADYVTERLTHPFCMYPVKHHPAYYPQKETGACYKYYALGGACAYVPYKEIYSYLAARVFEAYKKLPVTNNDIDAFISDNRLTYRNLLNTVGKPVYHIPVIEVDTNTLLDQVLGMPSDVIPQCLSKIRDALPQMENKLASNREKQVQSIIVNIKEKLIEITKAKEKGPVYASLFLRKNEHDAKDLIDVLDGYIKENDENISNARINLALYESNVATALRKLQNARLKKNTKAGNYVSAVYSYYTQLARIVLYKEMVDFLYQLKCQVVDLYKSYFLPISTMFSNVAETFNNNYLVLTNSTVPDCSYSEKLVDFGDSAFRKSLDMELESIETEKVVNYFISYMISRTDEWLGYNLDSKICSIVTEYFILQFNGITHHEIDYYLREKYQAVNQQDLSQYIYDDVLIRLKFKARPLFWTSSSTERLDNSIRSVYCLFPDNSATINSAAIMLNQADYQTGIISTTALDRISVFILNCGVPMYIYQRALDYKRMFEQATEAGVHIYEGTELDLRDFSKLHSIIPLSFYKEDELEDVRDFVNDYDRAVDNEIIYKKSIGNSNRFEYQIRLVDDEDLSVKRRRIEEIINKCSNTSGEEYIKYTEESKNFLKDDNNINIKFKDCIILPNNGAEGYEDSVVRDNVFASEYYTSVLLEQLKKIDELDSIIKRLQLISRSVN